MSFSVGVHATTVAATANDRYSSARRGLGEGEVVVARFRWVLIAVVALAVSGCVTGGGSGPGRLVITTDSVPLAQFGQPYSFQLQSAGAVGTVTWSVLSPGMPAGITLAPSGVLSGTPTTSGGPVRVQANDQARAVTKLLIVGAGSADSHSATATGGVLPEGSNIVFGTISPTSCSPSCPSPWVARFLSNGTISPISSVAISDLRDFASGFLNPAGTWAVTFTPGTTLSDPPTGPVTVVDAKTGAPLLAIEPSSSFQVGLEAFSPDGAFFALEDINGSLLRVFNTTTWAVVRTIALDANSFGQFVWSPDSTEIASVSGSSPARLSIASVTSATERTITLADHDFCNLGDWGRTNRFALGCDAAIVTISAVDGSDERVVVPPCAQSDCVVANDPRFSPSGNWMAVHEETTTVTPGPQTVTKAALAILPDTPAAPSTDLATVATDSVALTIHWN
jgi:hypothetical protein